MMQNKTDIDNILLEAMRIVECNGFGSQRCKTTITAQVSNCSRYEGVADLVALGLFASLTSTLPLTVTEGRED